jgi:two-component system OmpR family response regulator
MRILLVEDDIALSTALTRALAQAAHAVDNVDNGEDAVDALQNDVHDLVILDIGLPKLDGFEVLRVLRARSLHVPVLILTARDALEDRVKGLDLGADDYLTKPFDLPEFEARVRALVRRGHRSGSAELRHGRIRLDTAGRRLYCENVPIDLSLRELALIEVLMLREGRVVTKEQMVDHLYGWREEVGTNAIEVYIHRLRRKLEPVGVNIRTVRGMGYLLDKAADGR